MQNFKTETIANFSVGQGSNDSLEECLLFKDVPDEPLEKDYPGNNSVGILENSGAKYQFGETLLGSPNSMDLGNDNQMFSVNNGSPVPFKEYFIVDNGGSHIKEELVDHVEECLLDCNDQLNSTYLTSLKEEDPFKDCVPSENYCNFEPFQGKMLNKTCTVVHNQTLPLEGNKIVIKEETGISLKRGLQQKSKPLQSVEGSVITIKNEEDVEVSEVKKSKPCRVEHFHFYNMLQYVYPSASSPSKPNGICLRIDNKHSCGATVLCTECNMCFPIVELLRIHFKSDHGLNDVPMFHCSSCKGDFIDLYDLMKHIKKESTHILVYCRFCNGSFILRKHAGVYLNRTSFYVKKEKCKWCLKTFRTPEFLKRHLCNVTR